MITRGEELNYRLVWTGTTFALPLGRNVETTIAIQKLEA